jgi:hypothetical protein
MAGGIEKAQGAAAPSAPLHAGGEASAVDMSDGSTPLRLKLATMGLRTLWRCKKRVLMFERSDEKDSDGLLLRRALRRVSPFGSDGVEPYIIGGARMVEEGVPLLPRIGGRARVHGGVPPAKRGRSKSEESGALVGTMYCQLLDYFLTTALQKNLALCKDDIVDMALGYLEMAVPRPTPPARVEEHVRGVFSELLKHATQRLLPALLCASSRYGRVLDSSKAGTAGSNAPSPLHAPARARARAPGRSITSGGFVLLVCAVFSELHKHAQRARGRSLAAGGTSSSSMAPSYPPIDREYTRAPAPAGARGARGCPSSEGAASEPGVQVYSQRAATITTLPHLGGYGLAPPISGHGAPRVSRARRAAPPRCPLKTQSLSKKDERTTRRRFMQRDAEFL